MEFAFATPDEWLLELAVRLRAHRLAQGLRQVDLARMAGVSVGTIKALEHSGSCSMQAWIRVVGALGLTDALESLFVLPKHSIAQMVQIDQLTRQPRQRVRSKGQP
ncbi:MAG: helix-turn-helix transcriptional regulator [Alphaproteobacteria bacterium]|nr:helix-turn-helix transcriptional regulator [Alphaproteobacteria bacterium]